MRKDELYNVGGFDPEHRSRNVLDEFEHAEDAEGLDVTVRHYDAKGRVLEDRALTDDELAFFFPAEHDAMRPTEADISYVSAVAGERVAARLERPKGRKKRR